MRGWTDKTVLKVLKILNIVGQWLNSSGIVNHALFKGKFIKIVNILQESSTMRFLAEYLKK